MTLLNRLRLTRTSSSLKCIGGKPRPYYTRAWWPLWRRGEASLVVALTPYVRTEGLDPSGLPPNIQNTLPVAEKPGIPNTYKKTGVPGFSEKIVPRTGFEPVIFALKGRCPRPLDERGSCNAALLQR